MAVFLQVPGQTQLWITNGIQKRKVLDREELTMLNNIGVAPGQVISVTATMLARLPEQLNPGA